MSENNNLHKAKHAKQDEFYTQLEDIEEELKHYRKHFKDKVVLCNCDDPYESNFFKYFVLHFNQLKLKKLICTSYSGSPIMGEQISMFDIDQSDARTPYKAEVTKVYDITGDGAISMDDIKELFLVGENKLTSLKGNGDYKSDECIEILKEADIVVTNPPFSKFRDYVSKLIEYNKKFIILGNKNAITYKEIFPLIKDNKLWIGAMPMSKEMYFDVPEGHKQYLLDEHRDRSIVMHNGRYMARAGAVWFTNLDIKKRHEEMILFRKYDPETYPKYDNYDAINVDVTADIPCDYAGNMGVPITFFDKYCPEQFEIIGYTAKDMGVKCDKFYTDLEQSLDGAEFVRNTKSARFSPMIRYDIMPNKTCYRASNVKGYMLKTYGRVIIRNKHPEEPEVK